MSPSLKKSLNHPCLYKIHKTLLLTALCLLTISNSFAEQVPSIETLKNRSVLDDYYSNVIFGYNIVNETQIYASRFVGNKLNCTNCHKNAGTVSGQLPLNIAGIYPLWQAKNAQIADLSLKIRECFVNSHNGVMPPANSPEITAIKIYINYLSHNQVIGRPPMGRGVSTLPKSIYDPNPANGKIVYLQRCANCHGDDGTGLAENPPVWGLGSYTKGSGMNDIQYAAGFIRTKLLKIDNSNLTIQQAWDVAAFLQSKIRPVDPGKEKVPKLLQDLLGLFN